MSGRSPQGNNDEEGGCSNLYCHGDGRNNGTYDASSGSVGCTSCHENQSSGRDGWERMSGEHEKHLREGIT